MLLLLSGIAIGLMMMVNTEGKVGGSDLQNNMAFHATEGGIEKMYSDLSSVFQNAQSPTAAQICGVGLPTTNGPAMVGSYLDTIFRDARDCAEFKLSDIADNELGTDQLRVRTRVCGRKSFPVNMLVTASLLGGQEVSMARSAQVALIPVFQFGVFSDSDLSIFNGAPLDFAGSVHTNGDLYPVPGVGSSLTFHQNVSAYGNVVRNQLPNGFSTLSQYNGSAYVSTVSGSTGCASPPTAPAASGTCILMASPSASSPYGDGSVIGAGSATAQSGSNYNSSNWNAFSASTAYQLVNGNYGSQTTQGTGAVKLSMPFVSGTTLPNELIRQPQSTDTTTLSQSREYNMAQIHVLLADDPADLPGGASDSNNIRLANLSAAQSQAQGGADTATYQFGIPIAAGNFNSTTFGSPTGTNTYNLYFAAASDAIPLVSTCSGTTCTGDWPYAPQQWTANPNPSAGSDGLQPSPKSPSYQFNGAAPPISLCPPSSPYSTNPAMSPALPANCPTTGGYPYFVPPNASGSTLYNSAVSNAWSLIDGYLRVEYKDNSGNWNPVTLEWLQLGFARGLTAPTANGAGTPAGGTKNPYTPNAILLLQEPADRDASGTLNTTGTAPVCNTSSGSGSTRKCKTWTPGTPPEIFDDLTAYAAGINGTGGEWAFGMTPASPVATGSSATPTSITQFNWYPINFYDAREGEARDKQWCNDNSCTTNGVMNAVEIDVGNLKSWLNGTIAGHGTSVDYFRAEWLRICISRIAGACCEIPNAGYVRTGDAGLEDVVNRSSGLGTPDGALETPPSGRTWSPEDVNENGVLDNWGATNLGLGFWNDATHNLNTAIMTPTYPDPYGTGNGSSRILSCQNTARKNWVSGARHVLRLVDGSLGNVPLSPTPITVNGVTYNGGFTVASENPVYIWGDYNTNSSDTTWTTGADQTGHAAAAVIADAVTVLSDDWLDSQSTEGTAITNSSTTLRNPSHNGYYRLAIAGGKNMTFQLPTYTSPAAPYQDFGTDGGLHNFIRYIENWGSQTINYEGSLVSLYYSTYATGTFKCCNTVYGVPARNYIFDSDFTVPAGLPPGTPLFRDVESLGYRQVLAPRTSSQ